jgi:hypothetical protein
VSVRFEDLIFGKNAKGKPFATITFNVVKGISLNADIRRTILANSNDPEMCFIKAIEDYLESEYEIRIDEYNGIRNQENYSKKKVWNQTRHTFRSNVYTASENSGYGYQYFSPHSFRSGQVCDMLSKAANKKMFSSAFSAARTLGNWTQGSTAFNCYIKKSMTGSLIASRFINPNDEELLVDCDLQDPLKFHNLKSITPKWKTNGEFQYKAFLNMCFERLVQGSNIQICNESKKKWNIEFNHGYSYSSSYIVTKYCETFYPKEYSNYYNEYKKDRKIAAKVKSDILIPLLENSIIQSVFSNFIEIIDNIYDIICDFTNEEDQILMQNLKNNAFHLIIMQRPMISLIKRYKELKTEYNNATDTEILQHLILKKQVFDSDAENTDFSSRNRCKFTECEDLYIKKMHLSNIHISEWNKRMGLKGRSYNSIKSRKDRLVSSNWKIKNETIILPISDITSKFKTDWDIREIDNLKSQIHKPYHHIQIEGRSSNAITNKV